ncbi:transporter substrate-binding domain-containing protein [Pikeienuella piscinae]|uniref:Transporter substrate-binding domain-containing protein n=1 Tax=Pikeienuella piscinae TaxID=2748098 RepID=A0A7L5C199_9RHOB|nr:transporter substrate-binding domain-containing protein [Pikeienuella piscinae]QIE56256.1 transporter substrate-binding domain-containing protein [Pikeienuella piscinae]
MKFILSAAIAATLSFIFAPPTFAQSALNDILTNGVLKVGTTGDWNPMSVRDPATNSYKGFDVDVMEALAADLGVTLEFVPTDWKTLVNGVTAGAYHLTGSASISPGRMKVAGFSESYVLVEIYPFTTEDKAAKFDGWESINQPGVKVATELGTTFEKQAKKWFPNAEITVVEAPARGYQEVIAGRADVFVTSNIEGATLSQKFPVIRVPGAEARDPAPIAMILPQDDQVWINYVNNWVKLKKLSGFFDATSAKWGLSE